MTSTIVTVVIVAAIAFGCYKGFKKIFSGNVCDCDKKGGGCGCGCSGCGDQNPHKK